LRRLSTFIIYKTRADDSYSSRFSSSFFRSRRKSEDAYEHDKCEQAVDQRLVSPGYNLFMTRNIKEDRETICRNAYQEIGHRNPLHQFKFYIYEIGAEQEQKGDGCKDYKMRMSGVCSIEDAL